MEILTNILNLTYLLYWLIRQNFLISLIIFLIILFLKLKKDYSKSDRFLANKTGMLVLDWLFRAGKTRFMTQLAKDSEKHKLFALSNFRNGYNFLQWGSLEDFLELLKDLLVLGEYQNFTVEDLKLFYWTQPEVLKEKMAIRKHIEKTYKYIPKDKHCKFLILCDEWQNYFYNRGAMSNFTGDRSDFLTLLHQVRHFNSLLVFGTQNASELDVKFRKLSSLYITTFEKLNELIYGYNVYSFTTDKQFNLDVDKAVKYTKIPVFKINKYKLNNFIIWINFKIKWINKILKKFRIKKEVPEIKKRFDALRFHTKFNVNPKRNMYQKEDLFLYLNNYFKNDKNYKKMTTSKI